MFVFLSEGKPVASGIVDVNMAFPDSGYIEMTPADCTFAIDAENGGALTYQPSEQPASEESAE